MRTWSDILEKAWQRRGQTLRGQRVFRLLHGEADGVPDLSVDYYDGDFFLRGEVEDSQALARSLRDWRHQYFRGSRGELFRERESSPQVRLVQEANACYEVHLGAGPHTGLFLDQRNSRDFLREQVAGKTVLNLFCHTGAFTIVSLLGGAREVHSVDLSKNFLGWLQRNVAHNDLPLEKSLVYAEDAFAFLKRVAADRNRFDVVVLDPPTFARSASGDFSTVKNFTELLRAAAGLLGPKGQMLFSINTRRISRVEFLERVRWTLEPLGKKILKTISLPEDFPGEEKSPYLKVAWLGSF